MADSHPLLRYFLDASDGRFPAPDGAVTRLPPLPDGHECAVAFTGHAVVATALTAAQVAAEKPDGYGGAMAPDFLRALAGPDGDIGVLDATLVGRGTGGAAALATLTGADDHPRVAYARARRANVQVYGDERGLVTLAEGIAGRPELSIELHPQTAHGRGSGRSLIRAALSLVPRGEPVFAAVSPGNARSLRAFLAAGFVPVGSEVLIRPGRAS
ncbi:GNAT family N-acetyltransferase [Cryptosporangium aurantiacum]|uniref:Acetyltransferase (GNAT) family protein n=1 Tax=Cryptosporangium aurantiacum TaxID=134849 RepID=A0A1M7TYP4_9ACTN|nr:hypothetical protein [Cryptosporangium aurantiacum]SHN75892.1 hypothetical protein SAMN05443668_107408 [Cryptosporangium aurantiacum]